jgi:choline dehydrogenase
LSYTAREPVSMVDNLRIDRFLANLVRAAAGTGPAGASPIESGGFFLSHAGLAVPDLQAFMMPIAATNASLWSPLSRRPTDTFAIRIGPVKPLSRGELRLRNADPLTPPAIQPNYLADPRDFDATIAGVRIIRDIVGQPAFDGIRGEEMGPGASATTDDAIAAWIRRVASSVYHPVGTARMGVDSMAVVSPRLEVHGLGGLRIADASVMPDIIAGNTNAPTIMIAERAADFALGRA